MMLIYEFRNYRYFWYYIYTKFDWLLFVLSKIRTNSNKPVFTRHVFSSIQEATGQSVTLYFIEHAWAALSIFPSSRILSPLVLLDILNLATFMPASRSFCISTTVMCESAAKYNLIY